MQIYDVDNAEPIHLVAQQQFDAFSLQMRFGIEDIGHIQHICNLLKKTTTNSFVNSIKSDDE